MHARSITFAGPRSCVESKMAGPKIVAAALFWDRIRRGLAQLQHRMGENMAAAEASGMLDKPTVARRLLG
jgi:hypothetical protein